MIYYFRDIPRLQLLFDSPNKLAAFLCLVLPFLIIYSANLALRRSPTLRLFALATMMLTILSELCLVMTYSRGGYVAFGIGLAFLFAFGNRRAVTLFGGIFISLLMIVPEASVRVTSFNVTKDLSIWNRLALWKSACEMCVDNFLFGVGRPVGEVFAAWYQALESECIYRTAVSDYLTIGARYGMPVLLLYCGVILFVVIGLSGHSRRGRCCFGAMATGIVSYAMAAVFSTFYTTPLLSCSFIATLAFGGFLVVSEGAAECKRVVRAMIAPLMVLLSIISGVGTIRCAKERIRYDYRKTGETTYVVAQRGCESVGKVIVYLFDSSDRSLESEGRRTVRYLLNAGWTVVEMGVDSDANGYENARQLIRSVSDGCVVGPVDSIVLIGQNCGGRFSFMIGRQFRKVKKVVTIGAYASWPIKKLSPADQEEGMNCPEVLILNGGSDWRTDIDEAYALESICNKRGIPCRLQIVPDVGNDLEDQRGDVIVGLLGSLKR